MSSGDTGKLQPARLIWASACGQKTQQHIGSSTVSAMWRVMARRASDIARIIGGGLLPASEIHREALAGHLQAATGAARTLCNSQRASVEPQIAQWACGLRSLVTASSLPWLRSLVTSADIKAQSIEQAAARYGLQCGRARLGAVDGHTSQASPTKAAYKWMR